MATFINVRTTEVGQALLAQVHAGSEELTITGIAFGSGAWTDEEYAERNLTALNNEVMRVAPSGGRQSGGAADITCVLTNVTLDEGFALTELGVIAEKKDGSEVLYMADCVPPVKSTWISAKDEYRIEIPVTLRIKCSSNSTVEIRVESTVPVTNEDLENHNTAPNAHHDIRELLRTHTHTWSVITGKPSVFPPAGHTHTPNQVGLSNLPNAKSDSVTSTNSNSLATSKAVKIAYDKGKQALDLAGQKAASNHNHNSVYATKTHTHTPAQAGLGNLPNAKSDVVNSTRSDVLATSKAVKVAHDRGTEALNAANTKAASNHNHDSRYYTEGEVNSKLAGLVVKPIGLIELMPFRPDALPVHHHMCNGEGLLKTSAAGKRLRSLSSNFKSDWGITENSTHIFLPNVFSGNDGYFFRAVNGSSRRVGNKQSDTIREIFGHISVHDHIFNAANGAFELFGNSSGSPSGASGSAYAGVNFRASNSVPTASENRPKNIGMTPVIYLPPL